MTLITRGMGVIIKGGGKKIKGIKNTDPNFRKGAAQALKDMKKKKFIGSCERFCGISFYYEKRIKILLPRTRQIYTYK